MARLGLLVVFLAAVAVYRLDWPGYGFLLWARGQSDCGLVETASGVRAILNLQAEFDQLDPSVKLMAERDGLRHYQTPLGDFWGTAVENMTAVISEARRQPYRGLVRKGDVVLDVGAHIGTFSRQALQDGARLVIAVEASPETAECLRRNLAPEVAAGRAIAVGKAAWREKTTLKFSVRGGMGDSVLAHTGQREVDVEADTLDAMMASLGVERIDLVKMDIEGAEVEAIGGMREIVRRFHPRLAIVTEHKVDDLTAIPAAVNALGRYGTPSRGACIVQPMRKRVGPEYLLFE